MGNIKISKLDQYRFNFLKNLDFKLRSISTD